MSKKHKGKVGKYKAAAGGWGALFSSMKHVSREKNHVATTKALLRLNQPDGVDCPGCAWPEPKKTSRFEFCENGVKAIAFETTGKRVGPEFFKSHSVKHLREQSDFWLESQGRLTHPMRYNPGTDKYDSCTWDDAFKLIGQNLKALKNSNEAIFYTSGRTSNEAAFLYQLFGRMYGTNNFPDCSNMCHESSGSAMSESVGVGKGTVSLEDFEHADAIFVIGQNPGTNHPRMLSELQAASKRGATVVSINPLKERGLENFIHPQHTMPMVTGRSTAMTKLYLQPTIGGDLALFTGIVKLVLDAEDANPGKVLDHGFIAKHTQGFESLKKVVDETTWEVIQEQSGLSRQEIQTAADVYLKSERPIACWAMGLTQHKHAVACIQMVVNLWLLRGNIGKPGAGLCPVRGHSNVQGDRTMGIYEHPKPEFLMRLGDTFNFKPPVESGYDVVGAIKAMHAGDAKVFIGMGGNFASATPDTAFTWEALQKCDLTVHISTKMNRSHTIVGKEALILPCLGRTETDMQAAGPQKVTVEDSMSMVHASSGTNEPASKLLLSEPAIVAGIAKASLKNADLVDWDGMIEDYSKIRDKIAAVIPGFEKFNEKIKKKGGFYLGNAARDLNWNTSTKKANFVAYPVPDLSLPKGQIKLMTIRSHDQYNTTVYGMDDRYRGVWGTRMVIFMNEMDLVERKLRDGDHVNLHAMWSDGRKRQADGFRVVAYDIPRGCAAAYFPETNGLVGIDEFANKSRTPLSKLIPIVVEKAAEGSK
jgi:molybdopterin-dependent oxidoreductase alpha subunit